MSSPEEYFNTYQHLAKETLYKMFPNPKGVARQHGIEFEDLLQMSSLGLWKGCLSFNPSKSQIKTHLINNCRWYICERLKRETSLIKYDSNKFNEIQKFGLMSIDAEVMESQYNVPKLYHDIIPSDTDVQQDAMGNLTSDYIWSKLNDKQKEVIKLKEKGLSFREIGLMWGTSGQNVQHHFKKARIQLQTYCEVV